MKKNILGIIILAFIIIVCYFLYTIEKADDRGIMAKLPPWSEEGITSTISEPFNPRNALSVLVNGQSKLLVRGEPMEVSDLKKRIRAFITNPEGKKDLAETPAKAIISLKNERDTKYEIYLEVYNEIRAAYNELRNEKAIALFKQPFDELEKKQQKEIKKLIPMVISEAEPDAFREE